MTYLKIKQIYFVNIGLLLISYLYYLMFGLNDELIKYFFANLNLILHIILIVTCLFRINKIIGERKLIIYLYLIVATTIVSLKFFTHLNWDDMSYGMTLPKNYINNGTFYPIYDYGFFTFFPLLNDVRVINFLLIDQSGRLCIIMLGTSNLLMLSVLTLELSDSFSINILNKLLIVFSAITIPVVYDYAFSTKPDFLIAIIFIIILIDISKSELDWISLFLLAVASAIKFTSPINFISFYIIIFKKYRLLKIVFFISILILCLIPWALRNYLNTENPFFPFLINYFGYNGQGKWTSIDSDALRSLTLSQDNKSLFSITNVIGFVKYLFSMLSFWIFILPFFIFYLIICVLTINNFKDKINKLNKLILFSVIPIILFLIFNLIEFRYFIGPIISLIAVIIININLIPRLKGRQIVLFVLAILVCLQIIKSLGRDVKNIFRDSYYGKELITCLASVEYKKVALLEQPLFFLKGEYFLLHPFNTNLGFNNIESFSKLKDILVKQGVDVLIFSRASIIKDDLILNPTNAWNTFHETLGISLLESLDNSEFYMCNEYHIISIR